MAFAFAFSGDDIDGPPPPPPTDAAVHAAAAPAAGAFPTAGRPLLPPARHDVARLLSRLPSKMAYSCLDVVLDDGATAHLPRRELWDVRAQLMAEDEGHGGGEALGEHDIKTGVYEGGFKSWESSLDLVKVLAAAGYASAPVRDRPVHIIELGCGTALPSLALFHWALAQEPAPSQPLTFILADYNPSVVQLVTLPNFLLTWALHLRHRHPALREAFSLEDELELSPEVLQAFQAHLSEKNITLSFFSGAWSSEFVQLLYEAQSSVPDAAALSPVTLVLGAETIYSPAALQAFTETVFAVLGRERTDLRADAEVLVAAKKIYFGVGGSLDDFIHSARARSGHVTQLREETEGVRRGVVRCVVSDPAQALTISTVGS